MPHPLYDGAVPLADWGVIAARGADARQFLHGQLTQDIEHLGASASVLAGYCSAKGRLLASFVAWAPGDDEVLLACSADLLAPVLKRLAMFVLRARCELSDASAAHRLWGLCGPSVLQACPALADAAPWSVHVQGQARLIRLPDAWVDGIPVGRWLCDGEPPPQLPALDLAAWRWLEVASGVARIVEATREKFVPQMVNLELVGGVNFRKGCYPGQEVVARSQYRGTLKRRGALLISPIALAPGDEIFHSADPDQPAGTVALSASFEGRHMVLAELKLAAWEDGSVHAGSASGPRLERQALPYALPADAP